MQVKLKDCKTFFKIFTYFRKGNLSTVKVSEKSRSPAIAEASILEVPANSYLFWTNRDTIESANLSQPWRISVREKEKPNMIIRKATPEELLQAKKDLVHRL